MNSQREIPMLSGAKQPTFAEWRLVAACSNGLDAVRLCVQLSSYSNETLAEELGIDKGHFTRMMQGRAHFPTAKRAKLMELCGNFAPLQFELSQFGLTAISASVIEQASRQAA